MLGILGGMSWTSTAAYYRGLNQGVQARLGGHHSARLLLHSVDFDPVVRAQHEGDWEAATAVLSDAARGLASGGAQALLLATNTMHRVADAVQDAAGVPLIHIADPTADALLADLRSALADRIVVIVTHRPEDLRPEDRVLALAG